jgi:putative transposase
MLICNRQHFDTVLTVYVEHYNSACPHRGINLGVPIGQDEPTPATVAQIEVIEGVDVLGGLVHEYRQAA